MKSTTQSNYTAWRLPKMNFAIRGIDAQIAHGDTFHTDKAARATRRFGVV